MAERAPFLNTAYRAAQSSAIATYSHDRVVSGVMAAATADADRKVLRKVARRVVSDAVKAGQLD